MMMTSVLLHPLITVSRYHAWMLAASTVTLLLMLLASLLWSPMAMANHGPSHPNWDSLDLSADQSQRLKQLDKQWEQAYTAIHPKIRQDQETLRSLMQSPNSSPEDVMQVQNRLERNRHQLHKTATRILMQKKQSLTEAQRQQLHQQMMNGDTTASKTRPIHNPRGMIPAGNRRR